MDDYIEGKIRQYETENGWKLSAHSKSVLRDMLTKEMQFWERYEAREEEGHSHSAVGDQFNMGAN